MNFHGALTQFMFQKAMLHTWFFRYPEGEWNGNTHMRCNYTIYWVGQKVCFFSVKWLQWCLVVFNFI